MSDITFYEDDILAWSEQQAAALRRLVGRRDLPNELDLEHVAEEIEDVGRSELNTVRGSPPTDPRPSDQGGLDARRERARALGRRGRDLSRQPARSVSPSMTQRIDLHREWRRALRQAAAALAADGRQIAADLPIRCPYDLAELTGETFSFDDAVATLNASRPT
jgi:hypothetical protein